MTFWFFALGVPFALLGLAALAVPSRMAAALTAFPRMTRTGYALCAIGWFWTAHELDTIGIEIFDRFLRRAPFDLCGMNAELLLLAAVLTVLTCLWMPNLLPVRALSAILMLFPASLFPVVRLEPSSWRLTLVVVAYLCAMAGMFGMFYPWRIRQLFAWLAARPPCVAGAGAVFLATGGLLLALGCIL